MSEDLSAKMRSYLAEIYQLAELSGREVSENGYVSTSTLADVLNVSAPAVNRMVNRLKEQGLLEHEPYQGIRLTEAGQREALIQLRSQRIAEAFLVHVMQMSWDQVYSEAQNISSALSEELVERMYEMAGRPDRSPHGEPIPDASGNMAELDDERLSDVEAGVRVQVTRMRTRESDRLQYIQALGLMPGTELEVLHVAPFNGPMQLRVGPEYRIIGYNLAELIRVKVIGEIEPAG